MTSPPPTDKPTVPEVLPLVHDLYRSDHGTVGGCLHSVLDDGNIEDGAIQYCLKEAEAEDCKPCTTIARLLMRMSRTQRTKISRNCYPREITEIEKS